MLITLALLLGLVICTVIFGTQVLRLIPLVEVENSLTPTPSPVYGNVMVVTRDPSLPTPPPVLRSGSNGPAVVTLQKRLQELGYNPGSADGAFGFFARREPRPATHQHRAEVRFRVRTAPVTRNTTDYFFGSSVAFSFFA